MKKIIALLLALAMCFSLCACGESEADIKAMEEQTIFDEADALLTEGKYAEAIELFTTIESYKRVADKIDEAGKKKNEADRLAAEAAEAARPRKTVEITMDNWSEYFELKTIVYENDFGDLDSVIYALRVQESVKDKIDYEKDFKVSVKYIIDPHGMFYFNYDKGSKSVELLDKIISTGTPQEFDTSFDNRQIKLVSEAGENEPVGAVFSCNVLDIQEKPQILWYEVEISDIMGNIVIFE